MSIGQESTQVPPDPPKLYLDENIQGSLPAQLRRHGIDVIATAAAGMLSKSDDQQLAYAATQQRAILTFNVRHFERVHAEFLMAGREHWGVLLSKEEPVGVLVHRLLRLVNTLSAQDLKNQSRWLSEFS
jgi:hypothetical protein